MCRVWSVKCGVYSVKCKVWSVECGDVWSVELRLPHKTTFDAFADT